MSLDRQQQYVNSNLRDRYALAQLEAADFRDESFAWVACSGTNGAKRTVVSCDTRTGTPRYVSIHEPTTGLFHIYKL